jgi:hypothetical protein
MEFLFTSKGEPVAYVDDFFNIVLIKTGKVIGYVEENSPNVYNVSGFFLGKIENGLILRNKKEKVNRHIRKARKVENVKRSNIILPIRRHATIIPIIYISVLDIYSTYTK